MPLKMVYLCSCGTVWGTDYWEDMELHLAANPTHVVSEAYADEAHSGVPPAVPVIAPGGETYELQMDDEGAILSEAPGGLVTKVPRCRYDATADPTVDDDTTEGYAVGSRWVNETANKEFVCLDPTEGSATWTETTQSGSTNIFGTEFTYKQEDEESKTSSSKWQTKISLSVSSLPSGLYRVAYHAELYHRDNARFTDLRVLMDKKAVAEAAPFRYFNSLPWCPATGFMFLTLSGSHEFVMQYRSSQNNKTAYIRRSRLELWRVE